MSAEESVKLKERKEIIQKADDLISSLAMRKKQVTILLEGELARADWWMIRNNILNPDVMGQISSNSTLNTLSTPAVQRGSGGHQDQGHPHPLQPQ